MNEVIKEIKQSNLGANYVVLVFESGRESVDGVRKDQYRVGDKVQLTPFMGAVKIEKAP